MSNLIFQQQGSSPTQAGAGYSQLYAKTDGIVYQQVGTNTEVPIMSGSQVGKVLQVVNYPFNGTGTSAATSYTETGLSAVITPIATSSKILVEFHLFLSHNGDGQGAFTRLSRAITGGSTSYPVLNTAGSEGQAYAWSIAANGAEYNVTGETISMSYLDSPSTASAVEYNVEIKNAAATTKWNGTANGSYSTRNQISFMTLTEIAG
jgi:hypothetical protein